jgi:hypothetical protein
MINFLCNLATDLQSIILDISEKDELSNMFNYYVYIVNFFFGLISVLTENTVSSSYEDKSRRDITNAHTSFNAKCPSFSTDFKNLNILTNFSRKPTHEILR